MFQMIGNLGKKTAQGFRGMDGALQSAAIAEQDDVLRRIVETHAIGGTMSAEYFNARSREIRLEARDIDLLSTC